MNTLLGELATLNDVNYSRYRIAFKLRKLQKSFLLDYVDVSALQGVLQQTGVQRLPSDAEVSPSQLAGVIEELYLTLRSIKPVLVGSRLQLAQQQCLSWLGMAFNCSSGGKVSAGSLKIALCLFTGAKPADKARYIFTVLANVNGAVESEGIAFFCQVTDQLGQCLQEELYRHRGGGGSYEQIFQECLQFVRSAEDVEEEELDGGIRRQWLSQFEFSRILTAVPEPRFLAWLTLWQRLPKMEKVVHPVRCGSCTRKPIVSFRYQCTRCPNFHLCQMCFLKGRTSEKHPASHQMLEFSTPAKGQRSWHHRLLHISYKPRDGRMWAEPREPFVYSARQSTSKENSTDGGSAVDTPLTAITDMMNSSQHSRELKPHPQHPVAEIRIGSGDTLKSNGKAKKKHPPPPASQPHNPPPPPSHPHSSPPSSHPLSKTNSSVPANRPISASSGSPDSAQSGSRFNYEAPLSSASSEHNTSPTSLSNTAGVQSPSRVVANAVAVQPTLTMRPRPQSTEPKMQNSLELKEINKRLSMEVDQLLSELPPPPPHLTTPTLPRSTSTLPARKPKSKFPPPTRPVEAHHLATMSHGAKANGDVPEIKLTNAATSPEKASPLQKPAAWSQNSYGFGGPSVQTLPPRSSTGGGSGVVQSSPYPLSVSQSLPVSVIGGGGRGIPAGPQPSEAGEGDDGGLQSQQKVLEAQVSALSDKREQLASELEGLLTEVHSMYSTLRLTKVGPMYHHHGNQLLSTAPVHMRWDSAPSESLPPGTLTSSHPHASPDASPPHESSSMAAVHGSYYQLHNGDAAADLLDPLVEFTPDQLTFDPHRMSVAW